MHITTAPIVHSTVYLTMAPTMYITTAPTMHPTTAPTTAPTTTSTSGQIMVKIPESWGLQVSLCFPMQSDRLARGVSASNWHSRSTMKLNVTKTYFSLFLGNSATND
eukprot:721823_1